VTQCLDTVDLC